MQINVSVKRTTPSVKVKSKHRGKRQNPSSLADEAIRQIRQLYEIEKQARNQSLVPDQIKALRQSRSKPILDQFNNALMKKRRWCHQNPFWAKPSDTR